MPYDPEADKPVAPIQGVTDQRVLEIAAAGAELQSLIRAQLPGCPSVELACRHVSLAVQAAHEAGQENPPEATEKPTEQP